MTAAKADLTYPEVGATLGDVLPSGYGHVRVSAVIGRGAGDFAVATEALMTWQVQRRSGLTVRASSRVTLGEDVWMGAGVGPIRVGFRCRVVAVVDEERRRGFAYGTLPGHPESGEEAFLLQWREDDDVELHIVAFSRPDQWWSRIARAAGTVVQRRMTGRYLRALAR